MASWPRRMVLTSACDQRRFWAEAVDTDAAVMAAQAIVQRRRRSLAMVVRFFLILVPPPDIPMASFGKASLATRAERDPPHPVSDNGEGDSSPGRGFPRSAQRGLTRGPEFSFGGPGSSATARKPAE